MKEFVAYPNKFKMGLIAAGSLMFVCLGLVFAIWRDEVGFPLWVIAVGSWVGVPFFGFAFLFACYRLIVPKPSVIVNHEGIFDNASAISAGLVKWEEIADVVVYAFSGQRFLGVAPLDVEAFLRHQPAFKRWMMKANLGLGLPPVSIPQSALAMKVDELLSRIQEYRQKYVGKGE
jgi:hypothetical protein